MLACQGPTDMTGEPGAKSTNETREGILDLEKKVKLGYGMELHKTCIYGYDNQDDIMVISMRYTKSILHNSGHLGVSVKALRLTHPRTFQNLLGGWSAAIAPPPECAGMAMNRQCRDSAPPEGN